MTALAPSTSGSSWRRTGSSIPPPSVEIPGDFGRTLPDGRARYHPVGLLGQGAYGRVYLVEDRQLSEPGHIALVAVKFLDASDAGRLGLANEATQTRRVSHQAVIRVFDQDSDPALGHYIVYEYLPGGTLNTLVHAHSNRLPPRRAADLCAQVARGVQAIHAAGLVHGDLKPRNILLDEGQHPRIADFAMVAPGAAGATPQHAGTPAFLAPERLANPDAAPKPSDDIYALGAILFFLLVGRPPHGETADEVRRSLFGTDADRPLRLHTLAPGADADLDAICSRALARKPADRYGSAGEFASDLDAWVGRFPIAWTNPSPARSARLLIQRHPVSAALLAVACVGLIAAAVLVVMIEQARERHRFQWLLERERYNAAESRLQSARDSVRAVFAFAKSNPVIRFDQPLTPELIKRVLAEAQGVWTAHFGDMARVVPAIDTPIELERARQLILDTETTFWAVTLDGYLVSEPDSDRLIAGWSAILPPGDPWLDDLALLRACAKCNRIVATAASAKDRPAVLEEARGLARQLNDYFVAESLKSTNPQFLYLACQALADLHSKSVLDVPETCDKYRQLTARLGSESGIPRDRLPIRRNP